MDSAASGQGLLAGSTPEQADDDGATSGQTAPVKADGTSALPPNTSSPGSPTASVTPHKPTIATHSVPSASGARSGFALSADKKESSAAVGEPGTQTGEQGTTLVAAAVMLSGAAEALLKKETPVSGDAAVLTTPTGKPGRNETDPAAAVRLPGKVAVSPLNEVTPDRTSSRPEVSAAEVTASDLAKPDAVPAAIGIGKASVERTTGAAASRLVGPAASSELKTPASSELKTPAVAVPVVRSQDSVMPSRSPSYAAPTTAPVSNDAPLTSLGTNASVLPGSLSEAPNDSKPSAQDTGAPSTTPNGATRYPSAAVQSVSATAAHPSVVKSDTNPAAAEDAVASTGRARTTAMQLNTPTGVVQGSHAPGPSLPVSASPAVAADVPASSPVPTVHGISLATARSEILQPVTGSSTPMSVEKTGHSPLHDAGGSVPNSQPGMLHAPTWEKLQEAAKESRMNWTHPSQSRQVETDVLHLCRAIVKLPELNLTQSFISQRSGVSQGTLSHYVRGLHQGNQRSVEERLSNFLRRFCDGEFDQMIPVPGAERPKPMPAMPRAPLSRPTSAAAASQGLGHNSLALNAPAGGPPVNMTNAIYHQSYPVESVAHHQQMMENMAAAAFARSAHSNSGPAGVVPIPPQALALTVQQQQQQHLHLHAQRMAHQQSQQIHQQQVIDRVQASAVTAAQASAQQAMVMTPALATQPVLPGGGVYAPQNNNQPFKRPRPMYGAPLPDDTAAVTSRDAVEKAFHASKAVSWNDAHGTSEPLLLPVEVHVDIDGLVVYTFVQWDVNERIKSPESLAKEMREERDLPVEFEHAIASAIRRRLFEAGVVPPPPPPAADADAEDGGEENLRVIKIVVELNDDDGQTQILKDSFEWDIGAGGGDVWNSPETFSQTLCADAGIAQKHAAAVSRAIRHELSRAHAIAYGDEETKRTALSQVGLASSCAKKLPIVATALRQLSGEELLIQRREENEVMVHSMFVKPILTEVEIESRRREVSRKLEMEMAEQREKEQAEAEKTARLAATRDAALREAERDRLEADRKAKAEDGVDITPYTSLKLGYNSHPSIWIQGVAERREAKEPMFPAAGLAAAAIAEVGRVEPDSAPNPGGKVNGVTSAIKRERPDGVLNDSSPSKFVAVEAEDGTVLRLPLKEEGVVDGDN